MGSSKPTPTQDENDRAAMGEHVTEHEHDGSPPDPGGQTPPSDQDVRRRQVEAEAQRPGEGYTTRDLRPDQRHAQPQHGQQHARPAPKRTDDEK